MIDRKECEHLIGAVATDLADTEPDPTLPTEWCDEWDAAVREHAEPLAEQLRLALAEIDALTVARNTDRTEWMTTHATMRAEIEALRCNDLDAFSDGELEPGRAEAFRLHLASCEQCAARLLGRMQETVATEPGGCDG